MYMIKLYLCNKKHHTKYKFIRLITNSTVDITLTKQP